MSSEQAVALLPLIVLAGSAVLVLLGVAARLRAAATSTAALVGLAASLGVIPFAAAVAPTRVTDLLVVDTFGLVLAALVSIATMTSVAMAQGEGPRDHARRGELSALVLLAAAGAVTLVWSRHLVAVFLGLEILGVALYGLVGQARAMPRSLEAGLKYLLMAGASSAFLLFGMALVYAETGTMDLAGLGRALEAGFARGPVMAAALALVLSGAAFKLAVPPFHAWAPDVYEGAPLPATALVSTVSKAAVLAAALRWYVGLEGYRSAEVRWTVAGAAIVAIAVGSTLAVRQRNVKRLMGASAIAHVGFMLVGLAAGTRAGLEAVLYYILAYSVSVLGVFGVLSALSRYGEELESLESCRDLNRRHPWLSALLVLSLLSLAGIPATAGFMAKFWILGGAVDGAAWAGALALVGGTTIGLYYYLRVARFVYGSTDERDPAAGPVPGGTAAPARSVALTGMAGLILWLGLWPGPLALLVRDAVAGLF